MYPEEQVCRGEIPEDCAKKEYKPSRQELLRDYSINIRFLSIGCVIEVGCKSVPFSTIKEGMAALNDYITNPYETRKIWEERFAKEL
jgi:hypothetical protein